MSDELRSPPGHRPEQRGNHGAPAWWSELGRSDLPDDDSPSPPPHGPAAMRPPAHSRQVVRRPPPEGRIRPQALALVMLVVVVATLVSWFALGGGALRSILVVALVLGVPALLALATVTIILRRTG
jgi:hypothetical protein